uniref:FAM13A-like domain-containing protein n=1 Tax=Oryzias sinensis TaxID=183150 RepID=A0A8C7XJT1_9TELE
MTQAQMVLEKITLQKCLLYFESLHGRPGTKREKNLVKPLYDRYQMIKRLLCVSPIFSTIVRTHLHSNASNIQQEITMCWFSAQKTEEEDGSDEDSTSSPLGDELPVPPPSKASRSAAGEEDSDRDSDPLLECLRETRAEKKSRRKVLKEFEDEFFRQTGRICQKEDRSPMKEEYHEYKQLKAKLRLLEVLLSKQETL